MEVLESLEASSHSFTYIKSTEADTHFSEAMIALKCVIYKASTELGLTILPQGLNPMSWHLQVSSSEEHKPMKDGKLLFLEMPCRGGQDHRKLQHWLCLTILHVLYDYLEMHAPAPTEALSV